MGEEAEAGAELAGIKRTVGRLKMMTWLKVLVTIVIIVALVGHMIVVLNTAKSLEVDRVIVTSVSPGTIDGDFTVTFEITLLNPTSGSIEVDRLSYELFLEREFIGRGDKGHFDVEPGSQTLDFQVTFNILDLPAPIQDLFLQDSATLTIEGEVTVPVKLFGAWRYTEVTVPYTHDEDISAGGGGPPNPPPGPVLLAQPVYKPTASAELTWSRNVDADFLRYEVHTSTDPGFTPSEATRVGVVQDQSRTTFTVGNLDHLTTHYFLVRVYDTSGQSADSNRASVLIP